MAARARAYPSSAEGHATTDARASVEDQGFDAFLGKKKSRPQRLTDRQVAKAHVEVMPMMRAGDFSKSRPAHFVALYIDRHTKVYGVPPASGEFSPEHRFTACGMIKSLQKREFGDDPNELADFFRYVWQREEWREKKSRERGELPRRVGWRLMFSASFLVTDYRAAKLRRLVP